MWGEGIVHENENVPQQFKLKLHKTLSSAILNLSDTKLLEKIFYLLSFQQDCSCHVKTVKALQQTQCSYPHDSFLLHNANLIKTLNDCHVWKKFINLKKKFKLMQRDSEVSDESC